MFLEWKFDHKPNNSTILGVLYRERSQKNLSSLCSEYNFKNTIYNYGWHNAKYQILYLNQWHWVKLFQIMNSNAVFWTPTGKLKNRSCYANFTRQRLSITWQIITLLSLIIDKLFIHCNYLFVNEEHVHRKW